MKANRLSRPSNLSRFVLSSLRVYTSHRRREPLIFRKFEILFQGTYYLHMFRCGGALYPLQIPFRGFLRSLAPPLAAPDHEVREAIWRFVGCSVHPRPRSEGCCPLFDFRKSFNIKGLYHCPVYMLYFKLTPLQYVHLECTHLLHSYPKTVDKGGQGTFTRQKPAFADFVFGTQSGHSRHNEATSSNLRQNATPAERCRWCEWSYVRCGIAFSPRT